MSHSLCFYFVITHRTDHRGRVPTAWVGPEWQLRRSAKGEKELYKQWNNHGITTTPYCTGVIRHTREIVFQYLRRLRIELVPSPRSWQESWRISYSESALLLCFMVLADRQVSSFEDRSEQDLNQYTVMTVVLASIVVLPDNCFIMLP